MAMGIPDCWFKLINDVRDEDWNLGYLWHELTNRREDEQTISYAECHDQALVGGKTIIFSLIEQDMYTHMRVPDHNLRVDRGIALHKIIRLATLATAGNGYLNFMGNEFGHPEWIDFPRPGNQWSYHYARRQWRLRDDPNLKYHFLADFDRELLRLLGGASVLATAQPRLLHLHNDDKVLAFERGDLIFLLNLHPTRSFKNYGIEAARGEYVLRLDTDEPRFGGFGRLAPRQHCLTRPIAEEDPARHQFLVYLPSRIALVLQRLVPE
jgi:1,4-alpha-glucan branching enzyme